jgi:L-methionine (R)-S-oxide reductase
MQSRQARYEELLPQLRSLIQGEDDTISKMANLSAALKTAFPEEFFWVGFYIVQQGELHLGPFQGPIACYRIKRGRGVCGTAWQDDKTQVVADVEQFPGHIACSSLSRSEIVVPLHHPDTQEIYAVLDIDSTALSTFDETDRYYLEQLDKMMG